MISQQTAGSVHSVTIDTTLSGASEWIRRQHQRIALDKAAEMYGAGAFGERPLVYVDRRKDKPIDQVKLWGEILFVPELGPVQEAAQLAFDVAMAGTPRRTGHMASSYMFYVNGRPVGSSVPDVRREGIGRKGNVQLANLAPYAAKQEILVPRGVLYAAFNAVRRTFGRRVAVEYGYKAPAGQFAQNDGGPNAQTRNRPMNVPVLTIGSPGSNVRYRGTRPGSGKRRRRARRRAS